jgi:hypothetical protein
MTSPNLITTITARLGLDPSRGESALILGAIAALVCLLLIWTLWLRKPSHRSRSISRTTVLIPAGPGRQERVRRRRHHRRRNATLAEIRGLPPLRSEEPEEISA